MRYGKIYFKNQKAVQCLNQLKKENMVTLKEATDYGIAISKIKKWEKEGKICSVGQYKSNRKLYNLKKLIELETGQIGK